MLVAVSRSTMTPLKHDRGGIMHVMLSPKTAGTTSGFMGTLTLAPEEVFTWHYHPYSDECVYVIEGEVTIESDDNTIVATPGMGVFIPTPTPHLLKNVGTVAVSIVFFCSPLAPSPELGHVMLKDYVKPVKAV